MVRYGVQPALARLEDRAHLLARIALVRRLRVVVPALMIPTVAAAIATVVLDGAGVGCWFRWTGMAALVVFLVISFAGTVPINIRVIEWDVDNPPADWTAVIRRWELIDVYRSTAAILAFALFLSAGARRVGLHRRGRTGRSADTSAPRPRSPHAENGNQQAVTTIQT